MHTKSLATNFPTFAADFIPSSLVHFIRSIAELPGKRYDLSNNKLSDTARVAEWGVKNRNAMLGCVI